MKLTPLDRRYFVALGVASLAMIAVAILLLLFGGAARSGGWALLALAAVILWPVGALGRVLKNAPREPPRESN